MGGVKKVVWAFWFEIRDRWQSRGESRPLPPSAIQAVREASHVQGGRLSRSPSDEVLQQAAENNENYLRSFDD